MSDLSAFPEHATRLKGMTCLYVEWLMLQLHTVHLDWISGGTAIMETIQLAWVAGQLGTSCQEWLQEKLFGIPSCGDFPSGSAVKNMPAIQEMKVQFLIQEDPLEKEMATHSIVLAWEIPWTEEPGRLQSMGSQKSQTHLSY